MSFMIKGKAQWAFVNSPNTRFPESHRYEITLEVDKNIYDDYTSRVAFGSKYDDGKYKIRIDTPLNKPDGSVNPPPVCVDADAAPYTGLIGNGSEVLVKYRTFTYTRGQQKGKTRAYLEGVQIAELVTYTPDADGDTEEADGGGEVNFAPLTSKSPH